MKPRLLVDVDEVCRLEPVGLPLPAGHEQLHMGAEGDLLPAGAAWPQVEQAFTFRAGT